jgi:hypothetical protein
MKRMNFMALRIFLLFVPFYLYAQEYDIKPGKISMEELLMQKCKLDSNARAMIIYDYGKSYFQYTDNLGFQLCFDRILRIKIFNSEGYDWANHEIELYKSGSNKEKLAQLKCYTYNLDDGKITKEKLRNSDVYNEERSKYKEVVKFSMPQVREGSIIEMEYSILSDFFFNLTPWYFQHDIPVKWSEYKIEIPEFLNYKKNMNGYISLFINESSSERKSVMLTTKENTGNIYVHKTSFQNKVYEYNVNIEHWAARDVPPFIVEEPLTSSENYISKMEFELASYEPRGGQIESYTKTWEDINDLLLEDADFGMQLNGSGFLKDLAEQISAATTDPLEKMILAFKAIQNHMKWNERNSVTTSQNLRSAFNEGAGNSADINLILFLLLERLDIETEPVAISTRSHGIIHPAQPTLYGFNYVITAAFIDDQVFLMDATDPMLPFGMLPERDLNDRGRIISKTRSNWISLNTDKPFKVFTMCNVTLADEDHALTGSLQSSYQDYAALARRRKINGFTTVDDYIQSIQDDHAGLHITSYELINRRDMNEPYKEKLDVNLNDHLIDGGDVLYFNPMLTGAMDENPFKLEERKYPVEYPYPIDISYMLSFTVPDGYIIDEIPENVMVQLPEKGGTFVYSVTQMGNMLQVMSKIQIHKNIFFANEYEYLKTFYNHIITKHKEQVVLKKQGG